MVKLLTTRRQICARYQKLGIIIDECIPSRTSGNSGGLKPARPGVIIDDINPSRSASRRRRPSRRSFSTDIVIVDLIGS